MKILITIMSIFMFSIVAYGPKKSTSYLVLTPYKKSKGTAFNLKYKDKVYGITANHVCGKHKFLLTRGGKGHIIYKNRPHDFCIFKNVQSSSVRTMSYKLTLPQNGEKVHTAGFPLKHYRNEVHQIGTYIGKDPSYLPIGLIQTHSITNPTYPGNSGGPVLHKNKVIGVIIATEYTTNYGFFIPIVHVIRALKNKQGEFSHDR